MGFAFDCRQISNVRLGISLFLVLRATNDEVNDASVRSGFVGRELEHRDAEGNVAELEDAGSTPPAVSVPHSASPDPLHPWLRSRSAPLCCALHTMQMKTGREA